MTDGEKWVLVTGASTGIGKACVELLSANGFHVYAGARKESDHAALQAWKNVVPVKLDVTSENDVHSAQKLIESKGAGLFALVNNAGIGIGGPLMDVTESELRAQFEVNLLGVHRVTRALIPFLLGSKGRVVMMSSMNGRIPTPFIGPYVMSKFGLEGYSDVLRQEMLLLGVKVIIVEPGVIKTPIWDKGLNQIDGITNRAHSSDLLMKIALATMPDALKENTKAGMEPIEVARVVLEALTVANPKPRYPVMEHQLQFRLGQLLGEKVVDKMVVKAFRKAIAGFPKE